jgi:hypothetical protein
MFNLLAAIAGTWIFTGALLLFVPLSSADVWLCLGYLLTTAALPLAGFALYKIFKRDSLLKFPFE